MDKLSFRDRLKAEADRSPLFYVYVARVKTGEIVKKVVFRSTEETRDGLPSNRLFIYKMGGSHILGIDAFMTFEEAKAVAKSHFDELFYRHKIHSDNAGRMSARLGKLTEEECALSGLPLP